MKLAIDFDGTIIDAAQRDYALYVGIMNGMAKSSLTFEEYWPLRKGLSPLDELLARTGCDDVEKFVQLRRQHSEDAEYQVYNELLPGALEALQRLACQHECYLITARSNRENLLLELEEFDITHYFVEIINTSGSKLDALKKFKIDAIIGDTENDILPAKELGIKSVAVESGIRTREFLLSLGPDLVLKNISEVPDTIVP